jgi:hypothetical protein
MFDRVDPSTPCRAGEEGGLATMVALFLPVLPVGVVLCLSSRDITRSSYVAVGTKKLKEGPARGLGMLRCGPPWPAPHLLLCLCTPKASVSVHWLLRIA